jgi:excisionase family DNA binding protein
MSRWLSFQGASTDMADLLTRSEVCALLGISRWTLYRWMESGIAPAPVVTGPGCTPRWNRRDVEQVPNGVFRGHGKRTYFTKSRWHQGQAQLCRMGR